MTARELCCKTSSGCYLYSKRSTRRRYCEFFRIFLVSRRNRLSPDETRTLHGALLADDRSTKEDASVSALLGAIVLIDMSRALRRCSNDRVNGMRQIHKDIADSLGLQTVDGRGVERRDAWHVLTSDLNTLGIGCGKFLSANPVPPLLCANYHALVTRSA